MDWNEDIKCVYTITIYKCEGQFVSAGLCGGALVDSYVWNFSCCGLSLYEQSCCVWAQQSNSRVYSLLMLTVDRHISMLFLSPASHCKDWTVKWFSGFNVRCPLCPNNAVWLIWALQPENLIMLWIQGNWSNYILAYIIYKYIKPFSIDATHESD